MLHLQTQDAEHGISEISRAQFLPLFRASWQQGEHGAIIGPTGQGKTTLSRAILPARKWVAVLAVKKKDDTLDLFRQSLDGMPKFKIISSWPPRYGVRHAVLHVPPQGLDKEYRENQRTEVLKCMSDVYDSGGWCVDFDDLSYVCTMLGLREEVKTFLNTGRSNGISTVSCVTRPFQVPTEAFNQTSWSMMFGFEDKRETDRAAELAGVDYKDMREIQRLLGRRDFIFHKRGIPGVLIVRNGT